MKTGKAVTVGLFSSSNDKKKLTSRTVSGREVPDKASLTRIYSPGDYSVRSPREAARAARVGDAPEGKPVVGVCAAPTWHDGTCTAIAR